VNEQSLNKNNESIKFVLFMRARYTPRKEFVESDPEILNAIKEVEADHKDRFIHKKGEIVKLLWNPYYNCVELSSYHMVASFLPKDCVLRKKKMERSKEGKQDETGVHSKDRF